MNHHLENIERSLAELKKTNAVWIPTSTEIPDNTRLVLATDGKSTFVAAYVRQYEVEQIDPEEDGEYNEADGNYYLQEGWYEELTFWEKYIAIFIGQPVTHWMPLPKRPECNKGAKKVSNFLCLISLNLLMKWRTQ